VLESKHDHDADEEDLQEEIMKNVVSSKGKFASFLQMRNSVLSGNANKKQDVALRKASMILSKTHNKHFHGAEEEEDDNMKYLVNPQNVHVDSDNVSYNTNNRKLGKVVSMLSLPQY
jgi:hypothetical protein